MKCCNSDLINKINIYWKEHTQRMDDNRLPKKKINYTSERKRNIERPQTRWGDDFREEGRGQGA